MKILQISNNFRKSGGAESVFFNTIELLEKKGHQVIPFSQNSAKDLPSPFKKYFVNTESPLHNKLFSFESRGNLKELLKVEKPEIAHIHNVIGGLTFSIFPVLKEKGIPIVATIHDFRLLCPAYIFVNGKNEICEKCKTGNYYHSILNNCSPLGVKRSIFITLESYFRDLFQPYKKLIDSFIFVSKFQQNKFLEVNPDIKNRSYQVYNFLNNINPVKKEKGKYFLYVGRLEREKGLFTLINSFRELPEKKLIIVGDGELRKTLEVNKTPNIEFVGYQAGEELNQLIKHSHFIIMPSECYENNPMVIIEAYSFGVPVIGSNLGGISEIIVDYETGFLFKERDKNSLKKIIDISSNIDLKLYLKMSGAAHRFWKEFFSAEKYYETLLSIYEKTLNKNVC